MGCKTKPIILIIIKDWGKTHSVDTHLFDKMSPDEEELLAASFSTDNYQINYNHSVLS